METFVLELEACIRQQVPLYLRVWVDETIETIEPAVLVRSVAAMAKKLKKLGKLKPHCLTCGNLAMTLEHVRQHLLTCTVCGERRTRESSKYCPKREPRKRHVYRHIYKLKQLKKEVKQVKKLIAASEKLEVPNNISQEIQVLRIGIAIKVATLVKLHGSRAFEDKVNNIIDGL